MSRKSILLGAGIIVTILIGMGTALVLLVKHEPGFYRRSSLPPGPLRGLHSKAFMQEMSLLTGSLLDHAPKWFATFTDAQINSYFDERLPQERTYRDFLPRGAASPRVAIEPDKLRLAFRYGRGPWSTIVSVDLRVWLAKNEPNAVCLELQGLHAGALPVSAQSLLDQVTEACQRKQIGVKWYRRNGNPVALLRFQSEGPRPSVQLSKLELRQGMLVISGRCIQPGAIIPSAN
jgi:hypothetical protein